MPTHQVENQPPLLVDYNLFTTDLSLQEAIGREGGGWIAGRATELGALLGQAEMIECGATANRALPELQTHDRFGYRRDVVTFHPAWHRVMGLSIQYGLHSLPWYETKAGAHVARTALYYQMAQIEAGHCCPITMTFAVVPAIKHQPDVAEVWLPKITATDYDPTFKPAQEKKGVICGMAMTEKQGGSDVRSNTTKARPIGSGGPGGEYLLTGHKWFVSAPMSDLFLMLAQSPGGLSCFAVPRWRPDGTVNHLYLQRLKDKLGNRSNASSEMELEEAWGQMVGEEGRGVPTIIQMVNHTRFDCIMGSAGIMRQAVVQALHHTTYRKAFGAKLIDQPLMKNVLADLALESEAATVLMARLARSYDEGESSESAKLLQRIGTAISKYWVCKRAPVHIYEAMECLGGGGYVEESIMPRLYREAPVNSIWEGSGNVSCLDVFRAAQKEPGTLEVLWQEIADAGGGEARLDRYVGELKDDIARADNVELVARRLVERMVLALQASLLVRHAPPFIADAFCASRLAGDWGHVFGTLPTGVDFAAILKRACLRGL